MNNRPTIQQIGAAGETYVCTHYLLNGITAINTNSGVCNSKYYDICCINDNQEGESKVKLVQVKTTIQQHAVAGFSLKDSMDKDFLNKNVKGPWIFLYAGPDKDFTAYVLTRQQTIDFLYNVANWYVYDWDRGEKKVNISNPLTIEETWFTGEVSNRKTIHGACPYAMLHVKNNWNNIWN